MRSSYRPCWIGKPNGWCNPVILALLLTPAAPLAYATSLAHVDYADLHVVVAPEASPSEHTAADEFAKYWKATTGQTPANSPGNPAAPHVWIGRASVPPELQKSLQLDGLGDDGLIIKTLRWRGRDHLAIVGGERRGTLYGVYEFFERYMGVRWLTPDETYTPPAPPHLPHIDYRYVPPVFYRDISQRTYMTEPAFAVIHRMNGRFVNSQRIGGAGAVPESLGGKIDYVNGFAGWGHTFFTFINPDAYFDEHPEYFSEIDGERRKKPTQLCLSNPNVIRIVTEKAKAMLRAEPHARIVSVSQMDWEYYCTCPDCRAIDEREETPAASIVRFVNQVAARIEDEFPDCFIDTYAYMYSQSPPKTLRARDNVIVRLCTFNNDFAKAVGKRGSERNRRFENDLKGWSRIARHVFIYDYLPNFNAFQQPNPNLRTIQPNYRYFVNHGATGLYAQGNPESPASEFEHLRAYLAAKVMWDPTIDADAAMDEFIALYYGPAAPYIRSYIDLITARAQRSEQPLTLFASMDWMDFDTVVRADELFRIAFMNVREPKYVERLREAYLPVRYAALVCKPRITWDQSHIVLDRPPSLTFDEYWNLLQFHGVTHLNDYPIEIMRGEFGGRTPPRHLEGTVCRLENHYLDVWVVPEFSGSVIRLRDKKGREEWLHAYKDMASGRDLCEDLVFEGDALVLGDELRHVAFDVTAATETALELKAETADGLRIRKTIIVDNASAQVTTSVENAGTETISLRAKIHPEFRMRHGRQPEFRTRQGGKWILNDDTQAFSEGAVQVGLWDATGLQGWSLGGTRGPKLTSTFSGPFTKLFFRISRPSRRIAVDLLADTFDVPAGGAQTWSVTYSVANRAPNQCEMRP